MRTRDADRTAWVWAAITEGVIAGAIVLGVAWMWLAVPT